jgi:hypothetical protein
VHYRAGRKNRIPGFDPIRAMEFHSLTPFFPSLDMISMCSLWQVLVRLFSLAHVCFNSPGHDAK